MFINSCQFITISAAAATTRCDTVLTINITGTVNAFQEHICSGKTLDKRQFFQRIVAVSYTHLDVYKRQVSRFLHTDAEQALTGATDKFIRRFAVVERLAGEQGLDMTLSLIHI